jgi:hypothetical protein
MKEYKLFWEDILLGTIKEQYFDHRSSGSIEIYDYENLRLKYSRLVDFIELSKASSESLENGDEQNYEKFSQKENDFLDIINSDNWYLMNSSFEKTKILCPIFHWDNELTWLIDTTWLMSINENKNKLFENEIDFLNSLNQLFNRSTLNKQKVEEIDSKYRGIPQLYLNYLFEIGNGEVREYSLNFFGGLVTLDSIGLAEHYPTERKIEFFCTDFGGELYGFDLDNNYDIIELDHETGVFNTVGKNFRQFLREKIEMNK